MHDETFELGASGLEGLLPIFVPEEAGILEAATHDPLVPTTNVARRVSVGIRHRQKRRQQAGVALDGKTLLVVAQGGDQQLPRQREEGAIEAAVPSPDYELVMWQA